MRWKNFERLENRFNNRTSNAYILCTIVVSPKERVSVDRDGNTVFESYQLSVLDQDPNGSSKSIPEWIT